MLRLGPDTGLGKLAHTGLLHHLLRQGGYVVGCCAAGLADGPTARDSTWLVGAPGCAVVGLWCEKLSCAKSCPVV